MEYNEKLRMFFKSKGLSQKEVGKRLGHAPAMISRFWSGESSFGPDFVVSLVKEFPDIDLKYIFSEEENSSNELGEPKQFYGLSDDTVVTELKKIEERISNVRKFLAQNSHNN